MRRLLACLAIAGLIFATGCARREPPPEVRAEPPPEPPPQTRKVEREVPRDLCADLTRVIDAEPTGFQSLRTAQAGRDHWVVDPVIASFADCRVEGNTRFSGRYICESQPLASRDGRLLDSAFDRLVGEIDRCLARPSWYPRTFRAGNGLQLAGGERLRTWADTAARPAPYVQLKSEADLSGRSWNLRLLVHTMH